jgi:hypothetical protein
MTFAKQLGLNSNRNTFLRVWAKQKYRQSDIVKEHNRLLVGATNQRSSSWLIRFLYLADILLFFFNR